MEGINALTPNTAAFLDSFTMADLQPAKDTEAGLPPSAFFPVPGRDTPEDSSPSSVGDAKPKVALSDDSDQEVPASTHKRKAQHNTKHQTSEDDEEEDSMSEGGHEDKRQHNEPKKGHGRRKSTAGDKATKGDKAPKDNLTKAQRRKEQNRAAQKAFRERREAKVRDLEEKVAELEAKSFGASVENENLRGILRRLQEENVALKQSHFTFSMPINGAAANGLPNGAANGNGANSAIDWSTFANFKAQPQVTKPPSPPQSVNDNLRSIHDPSPVHRSSVGSDNSPESLVSINGPSPSSSSERSSMPTLFGGMNSAPTPSIHATLNRSNSSPNDSMSTPSSIQATNKDDVEALFRSLYPGGIDAVLANATNATSYTTSGFSSLGFPAASQPLEPTFSPQYTFLSSQPGLTSYADTSSNSLAKMFGDSTSYRDSSAPATTSGQSSLNTNNNSPMGLGNTSSAFSPRTAAAINNPLSSQAPWSSITENSVNEFLASLTDSNNGLDTGDLSGGVDDDMFSRQIEALISAQGGTNSPSAAFNLPNSTFSPTNYLNMSPSPMQSLSNSTPQSTAGTSSVTSPQTDASGENGICSDSKVIHVVGQDGRVMRPSEVWTKMGLHNTADPGDLLIDDLCDQMRAKATCKDGRRYMNYDDVENMVKTKETSGTSRFGNRASGGTNSPPAAAPAPAPQKPSTCSGKSYHDPAECQARLNAAYVEANGGL